MNMAKSLKELLPFLGDALWVTEGPLYERQRELVRCGLLPGPTGRGPGSGTPANYRTVSVLITSLLMADGLKYIKNMATDKAYDNLVRRVRKALVESKALSYVRDRSDFSIVTIELTAALSREIHDFLEEEAPINPAPDQADRGFRLSGIRADAAPVRSPASR